MSGNKLTQQLDSDAVAALVQAKKSQQQLRNMGLASGAEEPIKKKKQDLPPVSKPVVAKKSVAETNPIQEPKTVDIPSDYLQSQAPLGASPVFPSAPTRSGIPQNQTAYETFIEVENLPSKGLFYNNKLLAQALKVEDLLLIQSMDEFNIHSRFDEIFGRRIRDVLPDEILSVDELYLTMWLRATSFPGYNYPSNGFVCENPECDFQIEDPEYAVRFQQITWDANFSPNEVAKKFLPHGYVETQLRSGTVVRITLARRWHAKQVLTVLEEDFYSNDEMPSQEYVDLLRLAVITDIGVPDLRERAQAISQWSALDFLDLVKLVNSNSLIAEPIVNHICPKCGEVTPLKGYPFRPDTYVPFDT